MLRTIVLAWIVLSVVASGAGTGRVACAEEPDKSPKERMKELRRERREARPWIEVPEVGLEEARDLWGDPGVVFIDVTCKDKWKKWDLQIPGAHWREWTTVETWAEEYEDAETLIVYCA